MIRLCEKVDGAMSCLLRRLDFRIDFGGFPLFPYLYPLQSLVLKTFCHKPWPVPAPNSLLTEVGCEKGISVLCLVFGGVLYQGPSFLVQRPGG